MTPPMSHRTSKDLLFIGVCAIFCIFGVQKLPKRIIIPFAALITISVFNKDHIYQVRYLYQLACLCAGLTLTASLYGKNISFTKLKPYFLISLYISCFWVILSYLNISPIVYNNNESYIPGSLGNPSVTAAFIAALCIPFLRTPWLLPLPLFSLWVLSSDMAWLGLFIGANYEFFKVKVAHIVTILTIMAGCVLFVTGSSFFIVRDLAWTKILEMGLEKPIFGHGLAPFGDKGMNLGHVFSQAHNEYLQVFLNWGIAGSLIVCYLLLMGIKGQGRAYPLFMACIMMSTGHFFFHISSTAILGILSFVLITEKEFSYGIFSNKNE